MSGDQKVKVLIGDQVSAMRFGVDILRAHTLQMFHLHNLTKEQADRQIECFEAALRTLQWFEKNELPVKNALRGK